MLLEILVRASFLDFVFMDKFVAVFEYLGNVLCEDPELISNDMIWWHIYQFSVAVTLV